jgi:hypothetical protein
MLITCSVAARAVPCSLMPEVDLLSISSAASHLTPSTLVEIVPASGAGLVTEGLPLHCRHRAAVQYSLLPFRIAICTTCLGHQQLSNQLYLRPSRLCKMQEDSKSSRNLSKLAAVITSC